MENRSPWITHLARTRPIHTINSDRVTDIAIVGAGIAGVATTYFILKNTSIEVILVEGGKVAHGATGHNAGQLLSYFEKPFVEMVKEFGLEQAADAQNSFDSAWVLLESMIKELDIQTPMYRFTGYAGLTSEERILQYLNDNAWRKKAHVPLEQMVIANDAPIAAKIPKQYASLYELAPQKYILEKLETEDPQYIAMLKNNRGCMNSARFSEEVVSILLKKYPERFTLTEDTPARKVTLGKDETRLTTGHGLITAAKTILCTNGFEYLSIENEYGAAIDTKFHHTVNGVIGYMAGYVLPQDMPPAGLSYILTAPPNAKTGDPYFYVTRRPHEGELREPASLLCIGGPDYDLPDRARYEREADYFKTAEQEIDEFVQTTYEDPALHGAKPEFRWQGLMGYTPNRVRLIGAEPCNSRLLYNLGCNGIGLLPSIFGGSRIAKLIAGEHLSPSIFDPRDQRCELPITHPHHKKPENSIK